MRGAKRKKRHCRHHHYSTRACLHDHLLASQQRVADELASSEGDGAVVVRHGDDVDGLWVGGCRGARDGGLRCVRGSEVLARANLAEGERKFRLPCRLIGSNPNKKRVGGSCPVYEAATPLVESPRA